jgi:aspartate aminotransferase-like enzyme
MDTPLLMTPGPTEVSDEVLAAMAKPMVNPDLDPAFFEFYRFLTRKIARLAGTAHDVLVLGGEGILGLEAACASLIEPGDRVLCFANGIFGYGFADFVKMYGGQVVFCYGDERHPFEPDEVAALLQRDSAFKLATIVHCETPTGLLNPVDRLAPLLHERGILTVVDAVSSIGGIPVATDKWGVDVLLGGSQKCLSAPPGLAFLSISPAAWSAIGQRKHPVTSYYGKLELWRDWYERKWFPYTQPVSNLFGLDAALDRILADTDVFQRHHRVGQAVRRAITDGGLELFPRSGWSDTVTAFLPPPGLKEADIRRELLERHRVLLAGSLGTLTDPVIRIGHMGENCWVDKVSRALAALDATLRGFGFQPAAPLAETFATALD